MTLGNDMIIVSVTAWGTPIPLTCPPRRQNAVQELLPKQIMRRSARR